MLSSKLLAADDVPINSNFSSQSLLRSYTVENFSQYSPRTAFDVVERVAGFSIKQEDSSRGLGAASSNVLINGARVAGKSNGIVDTLKRIPASSIVSIEVHEGTALNTPGLSGEVVNLIVKNDKLSGTWGWSLEQRDENDEVDPAYWNGSLSMAGKLGLTSWTLGIINDYQRRGHGGPERVTNAGGEVIETRDEYQLFYWTSPSVAVGFTFNPETGNTGHLNFSYGERWRQDTELRRSNLEDKNRRFQQTTNEWSGEVSGDYEFLLATGRLLKLIAFQSVKRTPVTSSIILGPELVFDGRSPVENRETTDKRAQGESILRGEYRWLGSNKEQWQLSTEAAYNFFESQLATKVGSQVVGIDEGKVEENRFEVNVSYARTLSKRWSFQGSLGVENSTLKQSGDLSQRREFTRGKGLVSFAYGFSDSISVNFKLERVVGQLDFSDFLASVDLANSNSDAANPDLVPQQAWLFEWVLDYDLNEWGAATFTVFYEDIEDIVDRISVNNESAVGNLDFASRYGIQLVTSIQLAPLGWEGARWDLTAKRNSGKLDDPISGRERRINNDTVYKVNTELRYDIPDTDWAWGIGYEAGRLAPTFRFNQITETVENKGLAYQYLEHKNILGMTAKFTVRNFGDKSDSFERDIFSPSRDGSLVKVERRSRSFGTIYKLELTGTF